jgi:hypothetical protein
MDNNTKRNVFVSFSSDELSKAFLEMDLVPLEHGQGASDMVRVLLMMHRRVNELNDNFLQMTLEQKEELKRQRNYYAHGIKPKDQSVLSQSSKTQVSSQQNEQSPKPHILINLLRSITPEEAVADLAALRQRLKRSKKHSTYIQLRMAWEFLYLMWAVHIQIKIGNLWLPKRSSPGQGADSVAVNNVNQAGNIKTTDFSLGSGGGVRFEATMKHTPIDE